MRIRDWSSDVCSSDLPGVLDPRRHVMPARVAFEETLLDACRPAHQGQHLDPARNGDHARVEGGVVGDVGSVCVHVQSQIGSASCGESVCQYVSISGVAGALKKKIKPCNNKEGE